ncbi:Uncharacterized protein SCF082_LOCUS26512 [Durusdinium trenchii]|uniref:Uncharacterized protein n=1 Tax=Durusdinium trenchii TaxID=1381693 RepID=A0ABP0M716_9DINO
MSELEPTHEGGSGSAPDVTDCMREELHRLRYENLSLKGRVEEITNRLEAFSMQDTIPASPGIHPKDFHDEEKFVRAVTVTLKREEEVAFKVKAQFASEDTMWDKYESKMTYWFEEDLSAEYTKIQSRAHHERAEYEYEADAIDTILDTSAPMQLDARDARAISGSTTLLMIAKIDDLIKNLDGSHSDINSIFSSGAVEGYSAEAQEALTLEMRSKSIPMPKAKAAAKVKAKAKAKARPEGDAPAPKRAPASRCKRFAQSALKECGDVLGSDALRRLGNVKCIKNAERDLHVLIRKYKLTLPLKPRFLVVGGVEYPYLSLHSWMNYLLDHQSKFLLGGFHWTDVNSQVLLNTFWENLHKCWPDHKVFEMHAGNLDRVIPFFLHMDEGTGLRKTAVLVISAQCVWGVETADRFNASYAAAGSHSDQIVSEMMSDAQMHNHKGDTHKTRFLWTIQPKKAYSGKNKEVYEKLLEQLSSECCDLMVNGVQHHDQTWYFACCGMKGDAPALAKCGHFNRAFNTMGREKGICFECLAGTSGIPWEDTGRFPNYAQTIALTPPWTNPSPLLDIPGRMYHPESFYRKDPFHIFKQSIGGHFVSSSIILLGELGYWPGPSKKVDSFLERAYQDFDHFVRKEYSGKQVAHIKMFTKGLLHVPTVDSYPSGRFKGSDLMLMCRWLRHMLSSGIVTNPDVGRQGPGPMHSPLQPWHGPFWKLIHEASDAGIQFFHFMYRNGVWPKADVVKKMGECSLVFCQCYSKLAKEAHSRGLSRFHLEPSLHYWHHFYTEHQICLDLGMQRILSPAVSSCEMDEDFVGKQSRLSRNVHATSQSIRTIERYLIKCHFVFVEKSAR